MDESIESLLELAGNNNRYQYFALVVITFLWINCNFIVVVLPFLEKKPLVLVSENGDPVSLSYDICDGQNFTYHEKYDYSWVIEYGIECNKGKVALIGVFSLIGNTMGSLIFTTLSKFITHKIILLTSSIGFSLCLFFCTLIHDSKYFYFLLLFEVGLGCFGNCLCYSSFVLAEEIVHPKKRSIFSSIINAGNSMCGVIYSLVFLALKKWRITFIILIVIIMITCIVIWFFLYNSPRGFIEKKDRETTLKILTGIAKFNGLEEKFQESIKTPKYQKLLNNLLGEENSGNDNQDKDKNIEEIDTGRDSNLEIKENFAEADLENPLVIKDPKSGGNQENVKITFKSLFIYKSIRYKFLLFCFLWFSTRCIFIGVTISSKDFPGSIYFNMIILYIIEGCAFFSGGFLIEFKCLGRKGALRLLYIFVIISFLILAYAPLNDTFTLIFNCICRFCISGVDLTYYTYSLEVYPTPVRSLAFGINTLCGNGASILSPLFVEYIPSRILLTAFAVACILDFFLLRFLKETRGKPMEENIDELVKMKQTEIEIPVITQKDII